LTWKDVSSAARPTPKVFQEASSLMVDEENHARSYEVRRGHQENIEPEKLKTHNERSVWDVSERDGKFVSSFGALKELVAWPIMKRTVLGIDTKMDTAVFETDVAQNTIQRLTTHPRESHGFPRKNGASAFNKEKRKTASSEPRNLPPRVFG